MISQIKTQQCAVKLHPWTKSTKFAIAVYCLHYKYFKEGKLLVHRPFFWPCTENIKTIRSGQVHSFESYIVLVFWRYHHFNNMNLLPTLPLQFKGLGTQGVLALQFPFSISTYVSKNLYFLRLTTTWIRHNFLCQKSSFQKFSPLMI